MKKSKLSNLLLRFFVLSFVVILLSPNVTAQANAKKKKSSQSKFYKTSQLDINEIKDYIDSLKIKEPEIVLRQAVYETGNFKYRPLLIKNNLFGFRHNKNYLYFKSWRASIEYYKKWQDKNYTDSTEDYYKFLIRIKYATSPVYIAHLKSVKLNLKR